MDGNLSVALYARVSSQRQAEELTIQSQVAALRQRIMRDGFSLEEERCFLDEGFSGSTLVRPALERLRDLAHCGAMDRLYVHSPDRLARRYTYQMLLLEELNKQGVEVIFLNGDPQHQSPEGNLLLQMQGMFAEYERAKILERTRRGRRFAARQGKVSVLGHAPYGYRYVRKQEGEGEARYEIVLEEARVVRELFSWVGVEGLTLGDAVKRLKEGGVLTATGNARWDRATIRGLLCNPAYTGTAKYGKTRLVSRPSGRRPQRGAPAVPRREKVTRATSPEEQEPIPVPALVSEELFQAVAERLEENRRRQREQKRGASFLLSGLLVCQCCGSAYCGRRMGLRGRKSPYVYYRCLGTDKYRQGGETICKNKSVHGPSLEESVWADVCSLLRDPGRLRHELERRLERQPGAVVDASQREQSITRLKHRLSRLVDAYENGWLEKADFESRISRAKERLDREQREYAELQRDAASQEELRLVIGQFQMFADQVALGLEGANLPTRRSILKLLIKHIEVDVDEVRIVYKVEPRPFAISPARGDLQHCVGFHSIAQGATLGSRRNTNVGSPERA
ncbi:MAG TPA: recombinase family protein [Terriglobia bacterium]|nr:recombinase family protein [Terriglobia bacterium]